jgi:acetyl esterase
MPAISETPLDVLRGPAPPSPFEKVAVATVEDIAVPTQWGPVPVRLYRPLGENLPCVIYFHGGGFVIGGLEGYNDPLCRRIARDAVCAVISVDYRLAPEHKYPAAVEDASAVLEWAGREATGLGINPARIVTVGVSAGGTLATVSALRARDSGFAHPLAGQVLLYPVVDYHTPPTPSYLDYAEGHLLTRADMIWFWEQYLSDPAQAGEPHAAPLRAASLEGLPPALIIAAGCDPLRDEAIAYSGLLTAAGVAVSLDAEPGLIHGFLAYPTARTESVTQRVIGWIRAATQA